MHICSTLLLMRYTALLGILMQWSRTDDFLVIVFFSCFEVFKCETYAEMVERVYFRIYANTPSSSMSVFEYNIAVVFDHQLSLVSLHARIILSPFTKGFRGEGQYNES